MKSPTSIVNTLLESDHADYDPSLDPFSDPKNISHNDLGIAYVSKDDVIVDAGESRDCSRNWLRILRSSGLLHHPITGCFPLSSTEEHLVGNIHKIYVESVPKLTLDTAFITMAALTDNALARLKPSLGEGNGRGYLPIQVVDVEYAD